MREVYSMVIVENPFAEDGPGFSARITENQENLETLAVRVTWDWRMTPKDLVERLRAAADLVAASKALKPGVRLG